MAFAFGTRGPAPPAPQTVTEPVTLDLPGGSWSITWLDPVTGETLRSDTITNHTGGPRRLETPHWKEDVAIAVRRAGPTGAGQPD